jgi:hypothetical protein
MKLLISCVVGNNPNTIITYNNIRRYILDVDKNSFMSNKIEDRLKGLDLMCKAEMKVQGRVKVLTYQIVSDD